MWTCSRCGERVEDGFEVCWSCGTSIDGITDPNFLDDRPPDLDDEHQPMSGPVDPKLERLVTVASYTFPHQAHFVKLRLEAEGIPVYLADELTVTMDWLLANAIGGVKVQVPSRHARWARRLVAELAEEIRQGKAQAEGEGETPT
jgi:hypothetical protein